MRFYIHTIYEEGDMKTVIVSNVWMTSRKRKTDNIIDDMHNQKGRELEARGIRSWYTNSSERVPGSRELYAIYFEYASEKGKWIREKWVRIR